MTKWQQNMDALFVPLIPGRSVFFFTWQHLS